MNFVDYKRLRHSSKLLDLKEHRAQKTFYGHLFTSFPLSFQIHNVILSPFKTESSQVKERPFQAKEEKPLKPTLKILTGSQELHETLRERMNHRSATPTSKIQ